MEALCRLPSRSTGPTATTGDADAEQPGGASKECYISVGDHDRREGDQMNSESLSAKDDFQMWPINETGDEPRRSAQENGIAAASSSPTPAAFGDEIRVATAEPLSSSTKYTVATSTFGKCESSGGSNTNSNEYLSTEQNETVNISSLRIGDGEIEDQAMMMMMAELQQEGWADDSFIDGSSSIINNYIDISPEDWLHVAEDALPSVS